MEKTETTEATESPATEQVQETTETPSTESSNPQSESVETEEGFETPDFSELTKFVEGEQEGEVVAEETPATEDPTAPVSEDKSEEGEAEATPETPEVSPEEPQTPEAEATPEAEETPAEEAPAAEVPEPVKIPTREELQGMYDEHRKQSLPQLEQMYALTDEDAAVLDETPSKILPKLAAQVSYDAMLSSYNAVLAAMPSIVNRLISASTEAQTAEQQFYEAWPDLKSVKLQPVVATAIKAYRSANPSAKAEDVIKQAGVMAMIQAGLDPSPKKPEAAPAAPAKPKVAPAKPAGAGGATQVVPPVRTTNEETNEFADLAELFAKEG